MANKKVEPAETIHTPPSPPTPPSTEVARVVPHVHDESCTLWPTSVDLTLTILSIIEESGASQLEAMCALEAVAALLPSYAEEDFNDEDL